MNKGKLKALVHYIIANSEPSRLGAIRLNKILFFVDSLAYRSDGQTVTGETYIKRQHGPVPQHILSILGELEEEKAIVIRNRDRFGNTIREFMPIADASTEALSDREVSFVESVRSHICEEHTANSISQITHDQVWAAANIGEEIPMAATLTAWPGEITDEVMKWAESVVNRYEQIKMAA